MLTANKGRLSEGILIFFNGRARYGTVKTSSGAIYPASEHQESDNRFERFQKQGNLPHY